MKSAKKKLQSPNPLTRLLMWVYWYLINNQLSPAAWNCMGVGVFSPWIQPTPCIIEILITSKFWSVMHMSRITWKDTQMVLDLLSPKSTKSQSVNGKRSMLTRSQQSRLLMRMLGSQLTDFGNHQPASLTEKMTSFLTRRKMRGVSLKAML
jgi:hypothetical protein